LHDDVASSFCSHLSPEIGAVDIDGGHGRIEIRTLRAGSDIQWLQERHPDWVGLNSIIAVTANGN